MPDVPAIAAAAHAVGALVWVDGVHYTAARRVDVAALGADFFVCSPYKFFGPHHGVLVADPGLLGRLRPDKLLPSTRRGARAVRARHPAVRDAAPAPLRPSTTSPAWPGPTGVDPSGWRTPFAPPRSTRPGWSGGSRRRWTGLGATRYSRARRRTSTLLFDLPGVEAAQVDARLAEVGVLAPAGHFYALEASRHLGLGDGGAVRVGLAPYNDDQDVDRLLAALDGRRRPPA